MFTIDMLPADEGDCLWIEYGDDGGPVHRVLIDCGRRTAYRAVMDRLEADPSIELELLVLTHVDADHIAGAVPLLSDARFTPDRVRDVWFNGWRHLNGWHKDEDGPAVLGAKQGEYFAARLRERGFPWNEAFGGGPAELPAEGDLPEITLPGGMKLTVLGPDREKMEDMRDRWEKELGKLSGDPLEPGDWEGALERLDDDNQQRADVPVLGHDTYELPYNVEHLAEVPFSADGSEPNGSSISFLAEYGGKAVIFAGDAHAPQLEAAVRRLCAQRGIDTLRIDGLKMAHHGSRRNNSFELLQALDCKRYLLSSNGSRHHHPDPEAVARALTVSGDGVELVFNYRSDENGPWDDADLIAQWGYTPIYPEGADFVKVVL